MSVSQDHGTADARTCARVAVRERLGSLVWLSVDVPGWRGAKPGQFALLRTDPSVCFLPRAFSIAAQEGERVSFLIAPIGPGTEELDRLRPDDAVYVTGPLGNGFDIEALLSSSTERGLDSAVAPVRRIVIVAGGVGVAPFSLLLDALTAWTASTRFEVAALLGFRDAAQAQGVEPFEAGVARARAAGLPCTVEVATEDGSTGPGQLVTDLLRAHVREGDRVVTCGPKPMMDSVWKICGEAGVSTVWFNLETNMACGVGSCHGCVVSLGDGALVRVCHEGPVFAGAALYGGMGV